MSATAATWAAAAATLALRPASVDVWLAFGDPNARSEDTAAYLTPDEHERARRFVFARDRRRFVFARGVLRHLLGAYLQIAPADVRFTYASHGKPALAAGMDGVEFNMSHSEEAVVIAVSSAGPVGIDIEAIRVMRERDDVARRTFADGEYRRLCALDEVRRTEGFFTCWTRKEAFVKALGEGLSHPLDRFEVTLAPGDPPRLLHLDGDAQRAAEWTIASLPTVTGFAGALALKGTAAVSCFRYPVNPAAEWAAVSERCMA